MSGFDIFVSIALGIGLATAVGFRVFLPLLVTSVAAYSGHVHLSQGFAWMGSLPAMTMFAVAAAAEILAYYIPAVDNLLDAAATPVALVAGVLVSAAVMADLPPLVKWSAAIIAGGGAAGLTQGLTTVLRAKSTVLTGGIGNSAVATAEMGSALLFSVLAFVAPLVALGIAIALCVLAVRGIRRLLART